MSLQEAWRWIRLETVLARLAPDQAEGLRRLFVADVRRMIALVSTDATGAAVMSHLAATMAANGKRVLMLDEHLSAGRSHAALGVTAQSDLDSVLYDNVEIEQAVIATPSGVHLLAGGGRTRPLSQPRMESRIGLVNAFYRLAGQYDIVLINTQGDVLKSRPSFAWACQDVIILCDDQPDVATQAYARIKLLHQSGERRFHLMFSGMDHVVADGLYRRIASVSRRHLHLMPANLGTLPFESHLSGTFLTHLAEQLQTWPLPEHQTGHFPALMRRLLRGHNSRVISS